MVEETRQALQGVRGRLIELYDAVGADPTAPQEVARRYGINRSLTWKLSRVINASGPFASLNHLPGHQGFESAIGAFESAGASSSSFSTPIGYQTNQIVHSPGGYTLADWAYFGLPLQVIVSSISVILLHHMYP